MAEAVNIADPTYLNQKTLIMLYLALISPEDKRDIMRERNPESFATLEEWIAFIRDKVIQDEWTTKAFKEPTKREGDFRAFKETTRRENTSSAKPMEEQRPKEPEQSKRALRKGNNKRR